MTISMPLGRSDSRLKALDEEELQDLRALTVQGPERTVDGSKVVHFEWRVEAVISSQKLSKVLKPIVVLELVFEDGRKEKMNLNVE